MADRNAEHDEAITDEFALPGVPDAFDRLWTPHRMAYVAKGQSQVTDEASCPFCTAPQRDDETSLIVARGETCYVVMNLYPYNPGHLLVCPYRHVPDYTDLNLKETAEFAQLTQIGMEVLREVSHAAGFNLGMNQGKVGGAGIAAHLHQHIVPRWGGDGNFLPIIAQTKNVTGTIGSMRSLIAEGWQAGAQRFLSHQEDEQDKP
ncbi:MAG TPA: HIT domain-containing protein [Candidatus Yaniella excrementigallinarum]|nr:HIT domain-containing protein [Candidatus Yaniella excrementigallinarum]